jgi:ABC-type lipoprotein release transport system permease subunit
MLIFLVGALLGTLMGGALCVRYLRREIAGDVGPKLKRIHLQLDNLEAALNLALITPALSWAHALQTTRRASYLHECEYLKCPLMFRALSARCNAMSN